jgi:hypothetical protein
MIPLIRRLIQKELFFAAGQDNVEADENEDDESEQKNRRSNKMSNDQADGIQIEVEK